ncbi:MAG: methyl-accepting chemotaxis protein [Clostridiaceae bacterium]|nr:methyl-accepting chemotaxis protein [Clostridiaceae bacterium]
MLEKLPLKLKLAVIIAIPLLALVIITMFSVSTINKVFGDMKNSIFEDHLKSTNLVLNADRDMYQALTAIQNIFLNKSEGGDINQYVNDFNENIGQVKERTDEVKRTFEEQRQVWGQVKDSNGRTVFENLSLFETEFDNWIGICNSMISNQAVQPGWIDKFNHSREFINLIGESIEMSAEAQMSRISDDKNAMIRNIILIDIITLLVAVLVSIIFMFIISKSLTMLRQAADVLALGDINIDIDVDSDDEIGKLSAAFKEMTESIRQKADMAARIAQGDLNVEISPKSENDVLSISMKAVVDTLNSLENELTTLSKAAVAGKLDERGNDEGFKGGYKKIVLGLNGILDAVIKPIKEVKSVLAEISMGNLKLNVKGDYEGEYKELKDMMNETVKTLNAYINEISRLLIQMSEGNFDINITAEFQGDFATIKKSLETILESFNIVLAEISNAAEQVSAGSRQVSDSSQALSQGSTEQAGSIQQLTSTVNEIADQTKKNALNANQANELAVSVNRNASNGNEHMKEMLNSMMDINESSKSIGKIIKVIDEIAFQTNILALNAAVEAARAGQHGKGFAVVAEEVRNLAARSANAAKETTSLIEGSIQKVEAGRKKATETAEALEKIVEGVDKVSDLIGEIAEASNDQATGISQVNQGIEQVSVVIQTNSATAEQGAAASEELSSQSYVLNEMVSKFKFRRLGKSRALTDKPSPDILKLIEETALKDNKKKTNVRQKIHLEDNDLGKY